VFLMEREPSGPSRRVLSASAEPFAHLFSGDDDPRVRSPEHLDAARARRWFETLGWGVETGHYTYQQPLQGRSGPHVMVGGQELLLVSAYDYLGLIGHPAIEQAAIEAVRQFGTGTGGVRLLTGTTELHRRLEQEIAAFTGTEAAVTVSSGYLANVGLIPAIVGRANRILLDARAHRSLVDGCRVAGIPYHFFAHNDPAALEEKLAEGHGARTLIAVEGIYSMDGDICPLPEIVDIKNRFGSALLVDEAHSFGVLGDTGRGVDEHFGIPAGEIDFRTGSLSKAVPSNGGFIAASAAAILYLQHEAAPYVFSSALCPAATASALAALEVIRAEPERGAAARRNAALLRDGLKELGFDTGASASPIVPVHFGDDLTAWRAARHLLDAGIWATAVVAPAVPRGAARLRLCATAGHSADDMAELLRAFADCRHLLTDSDRPRHA
jgi:8-amino-7-oxononanoate synthase